MVNGTVSAIKSAVQQEGLAGLYRGYGSNIAYAFPTDAIKFVVSSQTAALSATPSVAVRTSNALLTQWVHTPQPRCMKQLSKLKAAN